jgi:hypothetical protein
MEMNYWIWDLGEKGRVFGGVGMRYTPRPLQSQKKPFQGKKWAFTRLWASK